MFTYQYPRTRRRSGDQRSQLRRKADACSWPCRCGRACPPVSLYPIFSRLVGGVGVGVFVLDNVGTDGRLEDIGQGVGVLAGSPIGANDRDSRARHLYCLLVVRCENLQSSSSGLRKFNRRSICSSAANLWEGPVHEKGAARAGLGKRNRCEAPSVCEICPEGSK